MVLVKDYLTVKEAGERLGVSGGRIRQLIADGRVESIKVGQTRLIKESDLASIQERKPGRPKKNKEDETLKENPASGLERQN